MTATPPERPEPAAPYTPPPGYMLVPQGYAPPQPPQPEPKHTTGQAHGALWCSILGWIIPILGWFVLGPLGFVYGIVEQRKAKREGRPLGVAIAATVIGAVPAAVTAGVVILIVVGTVGNAGGG